MDAWVYHYNLTTGYADVHFLGHIYRNARLKRVNVCDGRTKEKVAEEMVYDYVYGSKVIPSTGLPLLELGSAFL